MFRRLACLMALSLLVTSALGADPPRYRLPVGRVLHYLGEGTTKQRNEGAPVMISKATWRVSVVAQNADGSVRVVVSSTTSFREGRDTTSRASSAVLDLHPDGRYRMDPAMMTTLSPQTVFPRLPADAGQTAGQWQGDVDWTGSRMTYGPGAAGDGDEFNFSGTQDGPINRIYVTTQKFRYHFDTAKGLITRVEGEHSQDYGFRSTGTMTLKLEKDETLPADQARALAGDYGIYTDAVKEYGEQMKSLNGQPDKAQSMVDAARRTLSAAAENVQHPDVKAEFKSKLQEHDQYAKYSIEHAKRLAEVLNKPAADWSAKDLNDGPISAQSLRGKVIVMDFWYRGCGWCMYAMPQVKQLAGHFKDKPVAVLGMNTDQNLDDARFAVKELGLDYPQVQATGIPEKFGVRVFPTLMVIDGEGVVRDVHVGYSPDLYEKVSKTVESLLKGNAHP